MEDFPNMSIKLKRFSSGLYYLSGLDDEVANQRILDQLEGNPCVSALMVSQILNVSSVLAQEQFLRIIYRLLSLENIGLLCRDESICGINFYPNKFKDVVI
ncbi:hypothetical protein RF11_07359 [Thelohanellus kitauei]|uniref:Vacuolar protein-sorting-associated protein 36 n=1 Tax=Thelohanellus kitauei TaxID=669202 RepID=A0A0C2M8G0_THEKT|nr:hypothetical protein RF11_07359 [Thelohanellus kitauei]